MCKLFFYSYFHNIRPRSTGLSARRVALTHGWTRSTTKPSYPTATNLLVISCVAMYSCHNSLLQGCISAIIIPASYTNGEFFKRTYRFLFDLTHPLAFIVTNIVFFHRDVTQSTPRVSVDDLREHPVKYGGIRFVRWQAHADWVRLNLICALETT